MKTCKKHKVFPLIVLSIFTAMIYYFIWIIINHPIELGKNKISSRSVPFFLLIIYIYVLVFPFLLYSNYLSSNSSSIIFYLLNILMFILIYYAYLFKLDQYTHVSLGINSGSRILTVFFGYFHLQYLLNNYEKLQKNDTIQENQKINSKIQNL